jgi:DNA-binding LacI/PurR family transcriptional regulator
MLEFSKLFCHSPAIDMARLSDIASLTGVNISTVSKALRGKDDINPQTRRRIIDAAKKLKYSSRRAAGGELPGSSGMIGVICPEIRSGYYARIVTALERFLRHRGFGMLLGFSDFIHQHEVALLDQFRQKSVSGIVCVTEHEKIEYELRTFRKVHDTPVVVVATVIAIEDFDYVKVNDALGVRMAVAHLHDLGHSLVGFVGDTVSRQRRDVFADAVHQYGMPVREEYFRMGPERFEVGGYLRMKELLCQRTPPTAVLAAYDDVAIGAMRAISEAGLSVPGDISVIGIDGIEVGGYLSTSLTSVSCDTEEMAATAGRILLKKAGDRGVTLVQHVELNPELVIRESTAAPRPARAAAARQVTKRKRSRV